MASAGVFTRGSCLTIKSRTDDGAMFSRNDCQWSPSSNDTYTCVSDPAKSNPFRRGSSRTTLTAAPAGIPLTISFHVFPPSCVRKMCGFMSSSRSVLTAAYAVNGSKRPGSIVNTFMTAVTCGVKGGRAADGLDSDRLLTGRVSRIS